MFLAYSPSCTSFSIFTKLYNCWIPEHLHCVCFCDGLWAVTTTAIFLEFVGTNLNWKILYLWPIPSLPSRRNLLAVLTKMLLIWYLCQSWIQTFSQTTSVTKEASTFILLVICCWLQIGEFCCFQRCESYDRLILWWTTVAFQVFSYFFSLVL